LAAVVVHIQRTSTGAIDTLTLSDAAFGEVVATVDTIEFKTNPGNSPDSTRDKIIVNALLKGVVAEPDPSGPGLVKVRRTSTGRNVVSVKLIKNGTEFLIPNPPDSILSKGGQKFFVTGAPAPSLTTYGLIILALLLAGTAVWMFRRRLAAKGGLA
jgi:hypothetical protein